MKKIPRIVKLKYLFAGISILLVFSLLFVIRQTEAVTPFDMLPKIEGAEYVGMDTCAVCHEKEAREFEMSAHARISMEGAEGAAQGCEMCHGPGSLHADSEGGRNTPGRLLINNPRDNPQTCFACHMEKKMEFRLPYHHPVLEGKMSCADCHNLHGPEARPWTSTTLEGTNQTCFKCHKDKRGPFPWPHEALREGCQSCHKVHGSITDKMLVARDANLCLRCHVQTDFPVIGEEHSVSRLLQGTCWSTGCHPAIHGSYFDGHFRE